MTEKCLLGLGVVAALAGCDASCEEPTLEQCQDAAWFDTECGQAEYESMRSNTDSTCNVLLTEHAKSVLSGLSEELVAVPEGAGGGTAMAKIVPNPEARLSIINLPSTYASNAQRAAMNARDSGLSAEDQALRDAWIANGDRVESCEEYVYEKYYDYMRFDDSVVSRKTDTPYVAQKAFENGSFGAKVVSGESLKMKEGIDMTVQAPTYNGYIVRCSIPSTRMVVDNVFTAVPRAVLKEGERERFGDDWIHQCNGEDIDYHLYTPPSPQRVMQWHEAKRAEVLAAGFEPVELDAMYASVKEFRELVFDYYDWQNDWGCCNADFPDTDCCKERRAIGDSLEQRMRVLFDLALSKGCLERDSVTLCSWSPRFFVESLQETFGLGMEEDYQQCLERTEDNFEKLKTYEFKLPSGESWPSQPGDANDSIEDCWDWEGIWDACPVDDYAVTASAIDLFLSRFTQYEAAVGRYWQAIKEAMPRELFGAHGKLHLPGKTTEGDPAPLESNREVGNAIFGAFYNYRMHWSLPELSAEMEDRAEVCSKGPAADASFKAGAWAFGGSRVTALDAKMDANVDNEISGHLHVVGENIWFPEAPPAGDWLVNTTGAVSYQIVPFCKERNRTRCPKLRFPFSVVGIPMSISGAISGSVSMTPRFRTEKAAQFPENSGEECWKFEMGFTPSVDLTGEAALNALDLVVARVGIACQLTLIGVGFPMNWTLREIREDNPPKPLPDLRLDVNSSISLEVRLLEGKISVFAEIKIGPFGATVSKKLVGWPPIRFSHTLSSSGYNFILNDLLFLIREEI